MSLHRVACVQVNASNDLAANIEVASSYIDQAAKAGAALVALPENVVMMDFGRERILAAALPEAGHPALARFSQLARDKAITLLVGSLHIKLPDGKLANRCYVIGPDGALLARYDKIHLFDVDLANGESYRESDNFAAGEQAVLVDTAVGRLGLSICYDLRFPQLYRQYGHNGAEILTVPAAFTRTTGQAHWHVLLRARAIETGCFVLAPGQCGDHAERRQTFGHSLIIDPWGEILADGGEAPGLILADLDLAKVGRTRAMVPSLRHDRPFTLATPQPNAQP